MSTLTLVQAVLAGVLLLCIVPAFRRTSGGDMSDQIIKEGVALLAGALLTGDVLVFVARHINWGALWR